MDPFLDHLERDNDVITNGSRTTVYTFILQEVMKPLYMYIYLQPSTLFLAVQY